MKFGKKGTAASEMWAPDTIIFWIIFGIVLSLVAIVFVLIISKSGAEKAKIYENLESFNLMQRFLKSPNCFVFEKDEIFSVGVIDYSTFNEQRLSSCYKTDQSTFPAFRLILSSDTGDIFKTIKTSNWNDNRNFEEKTTPKSVMIYSQDKSLKGKIEIEVQNVR